MYKKNGAQCTEPKIKTKETHKIILLLHFDCLFGLVI